MSSRCFLGIDVGTTATKAAVLTEAGEPIRRVRVAHATGLPTLPGRVDPVSWWISVQEACHALEAGQLNIAGIGLSVHSPVAVPMDSSGKHLTAGYRYEAPGLTDMVAWLQSGLTPDDIRHSGNRITPATYIAAAYLLLREKEPEIVEDLHVLGSVGTYIGHRLTGHDAIDPTQASYFGPFDTTGTWTWQEDLLRRLGIPQRVLPPVQPSSEVLGRLTNEAAKALRLRPGTPVVTGAGDTACAAFAAGIDRNAARLLTLGTTHVVTDHGTVPAEENLHLQRAHVRRGQWLRHGASNGGLALSIAAKALGYGAGGQAVSAMVDRAMSAGAATIAGAPFFIPHVRPERAPFWLEEPRSAFLGLLPDADETSMAWAAVEGVLFVDRMISESYPDDPLRELLLAGDVSGSGCFMQLAADMFGRPFTVSAESHLPALGAAMLAAQTADDSLYLHHHTHPVKPRQEFAPLIEQRWQDFRQEHSRFLHKESKSSTV